MSPGFDIAPKGLGVVFIKSLLYDIVDVVDFGFLEFFLACFLESLESVPLVRLLGMFVQSCFASVIIYFNNEHASVIMIAIKPCGTQIYLFLYIKSHLIRIHTAINYYLIIGMVQARGDKSLGGV